MRGRLLLLSAALILLTSLGSGPALAQSFYEGKTLRIIVGLGAGGDSVVGKVRAEQGSVAQSPVLCGIVRGCGVVVQPG